MHVFTIHANVSLQLLITKSLTPTRLRNKPEVKSLPVKEPDT